MKARLEEYDAPDRSLEGLLRQAGLLQEHVDGVGTPDGIYAAIKTGASGSDGP